MSQYTTVSFDKPKYRRLKERYNKAVERSEDQFYFEGGEYLTDYAKYVLEYLEMEGMK